MAAPSRRVVIAGAFAFGAVGNAGEAAAQPADALFSTIGVDVGPLRAKGLGAYADALSAMMHRELTSAFADRRAGSGPRLLVRIDAVSMRDYVGGENRLFGSGTPNDYLEGEALIVGRGGEVLRRQPQLSAVPASSGGAWYVEGAEDRRLLALVQHFAGWLRRRL